MFAIEWNNLAMVIFVVGSVAACFLGLAMLNGELTNLETLVAEALFGTTLALYILRLQKKESAAIDKAVLRIDKVTNLTAEMIAQETDRANKRKRYCLGLMKGWLAKIRENHERFLSVCNRLVAYEVEQSAKKSYSETTRMDQEWVKLVAIPNYKNCVMQISDLLSENYLSTYGLQEIEEIFASLLDPSIIFADKEKLAHHIQELNYRVEKRGTFDFFLEQIEKEMPAKPLL